PQGNIKLRLAIEKARNSNMPKEKIERAIERGKGDSAEDNLEESLYEGFGPAGVGIMIETASNNKQRTVAELKNILERGGGRLATSGSVSHFFSLVGLITVPKLSKPFDEMMEEAIEVGAIDLEDAGDMIDIYTNHDDLHRIKEVLEKKGIPISSFELFYKPNTTIPITDVRIARQMLNLLTTLEEIDDVQKVYANFDMPDELLTSSGVHQ
ncbi:YebC/PmpR family DNA-binding transcriptional regulator, partial [Candidatus Gottesmanbacteria bacterium]|nr:YebC/PmpR family DNA-binding transcriptional regulator [Candidatus Gottesmanbacteria bacterium]